MNTRLVNYLFYCWGLLFLLSMTSCDVIGTIFEAGAWAGGLLVVGIIVLVIWLFSRLFGRGKRT